MENCKNKNELLVIENDNLFGYSILSVSLDNGLLKLLYYHISHIYERFDEFLESPNITLVLL